MFENTIIKTIYNPTFSEEFKAWIKKNINPSMIGFEDKENLSYHLNLIISSLSELDYQVITDLDKAQIKELQINNIEYVEFS